MKNLTLTCVKTQSQFRDFINLPWQLFKKNPNWVPPLRMTVKNYLNVDKNPFYKHSVLTMWNVYNGKRCVGRIASIIDENHNNFHNEKTCFWGFFEAIEDGKVSKLLFNAVKKWAEKNDMDMLRGPMNPSTNHECGLQISGFEKDPYFMMPMNPPYYAKLVDEYGFSKAKDLYAWLGTTKDNTVDQRRIRIANKQISKKRYSFRSLNMKDFKNEINRLFEIYNNAWEKNWGFVPMTRAEFNHMSKELKAIINPRLCVMVEVDNEPVGFSLAVPNLNQVTKRIRSGRLLPFGIIKLLWFTKIKPSIDTYRIITLGVKKQYQAAGLAPILYQKTEEIMRELHVREAELSWVLDDNHAMNSAIENLGAQCYKTYRIYEMSLHAINQT